MGEVGRRGQPDRLLELPVEQGEGDHVCPEYRTPATGSRLGSEGAPSTLPLSSTSVTSRAAVLVLVLANTNTANRASMTGRARPGTGPGLAAMASMTRNAMLSVIGTSSGGPTLYRAGYEQLRQDDQCDRD